MSTASARIDPRIRARRVAVIRAQGRRRLRVLVAALAAVVVVVGAWLLVMSPVLDVDRITVRGVDDQLAIDVRSAAGVETGTPLLLLDPGRVERRIEAVPAVLDARVDRELPDGLRITVVERTPAAWAPSADGSIAVLDRSGRAIASAAAAPPLPEITGLERVPALGRTSDASAAAAGVLADLPSELRARVTTVVTAPGAVTVGLDDGVEVRLGRPRNVATKARTAEAVLAARGDAPIAYVDVSVPTAPVTGRG